MSENKPSRAVRLKLGLLVLALGVGAFFLLRTAPLPTRADAIQARLELAAGPVLVLSAGQADGDARQATSGAPLLEGSTIKAGEGARALVRLPDGSSVFLRAGTSVKLVASGLELDRGEYWLDAPPADREPLVHRAGDVVLSAADSGLSVKRTADGADIYVARGMGIVTSKGGRIEVHAGERASIKGADAPQVAPVAFWDDWTGGMADAIGAEALGAGSGSVYGIDVGAPAGTPATRLQLKAQSVKAVLRYGLGETSVDQTFFNPSPRAVEGWYWFTVPEGSSVTGFAVETDGVLVEGEFIEQREAAQKYSVARSMGASPAVLEWVDGRSYRARIFPVPATGTRRVVLRYIELKPAKDGKLSYLYPMAHAATRIGEFSLSVDLGDDGSKMKIATVADARVEENGRLVTMRRSGFTPRADFQLEAVLPEQRPTLSLARFETHDGSADYIMARYSPEVDWAKVKPMPAEVVVVVDTSAAGDEAAQQLKTAAAEALLRSLSEGDKFALMALDVRARVLYPDKGLASASEAEIAKALEKLAGTPPGGASDLAAMFEPALELLHSSEQPAMVYVGDGIPTSGETTGEQLSEHLRRALSSSRARLFAVGVGADADHALLGELARTGGGREFRVDAARATTPVALELTAAVKAPTITDFTIDLGAGLDEPFVSASGKVSRGSEVVVLARSHHVIADEVSVHGRLGGEAFDRKVKVSPDKGVIASFVPRLWAAEYVRRLLGGAGGADAERGRIVALGVDYGIMTPFTSILALDSEESYSRMKIKRKDSPLRGVRLSELTREQERRLALTFEAQPASVSVGCSKKSEAAAASDPRSESKEAGSLPQSARRNESDSMPPEAEVAPPAGVDAAPSPASPAAQKGAPPAAPGRAEMSGDEYGRSGGSRGDDKENNSGNQSNPLGRGAHTAKPRDGDTGLLATTRPPPPPPPPIVQTTCSDVAGRPLEQRMSVWRKRLKNATSAGELLTNYSAAMRACELNDWQAEREFLRLLQRRVNSEADAQLVLASLRSRPDVQKFVAKLILRRVTDERIVAAVERVLFGSAIDWNGADLELAEIADLDKRILKLRGLMTRAPDDPNGDLRLVKLLVTSGKSDEALTVGRRLRDHGLLTVGTARQLGDVLARAKLEDEAIRTYSEIVEFDPDNLESRQLLGDTYLARGWYEPAYRQYKTATEMSAGEPLAWLRLAGAAAGTGRIDEALRLERQVATAQGRPGPDDPRRWAKLWSAARLGRLLAKPPAGESTTAIERKLKELQLMSGPGTLVILTWEDLSSDALLVSLIGAEAIALGELVDAHAIGLSAVLLPAADATRVTLNVRLRSAPRDESLKLMRHDLRWDGTHFDVKVSDVELAAAATKVAL